VGDLTGLCARAYSIRTRRSTLAMTAKKMHPVLPAHLPYVEKGRFQEAISDLQRAIEIDHKAINLAALGHIYALSGRKQEAQKILLSLDKRAEHEYVDPWCYGVIYAGLGDRDAAFHWLEKAYQQRSYWIFALKVAAVCDSLHSDPRFSAMVHRLGLDQ